MRRRASDLDAAEVKLAARLKMVRETDLEASLVHDVLLRFMAGLWDPAERRASRRPAR